MILANSRPSQSAFVSVLNPVDLTGTPLVEDVLGSLPQHLPEGEYVGFYFDFEYDEDIYGVVTISEGAAVFAVDSSVEPMRTLGM